MAQASFKNVPQILVFFKKKNYFILLEHRYIHPSDHEQHIKDDEVPLANLIQK